MSNAVDWDSAPEGAEFYAAGDFRKDGYFWSKDGIWKHGMRQSLAKKECLDYCERPQEKPMKYKYGVEYPTNGVKPDLPDDVLVEQFWRGRWLKTVRACGDWRSWVGTSAFRIVDDRYKPAAAPVTPTTAAEYLSACAQVQLERGKQYDASGTGERSFDAAAEAFNCITGKQLRGSDVCLILELVKKVRQYSAATRLHADSVLDAVSYASLWAEELTKELK